MAGAEEKVREEGPDPVAAAFGEAFAYIAGHIIGRVLVVVIDRMISNLLRQIEVVFWNVLSTQQDECLRGGVSEC